MRMRLRAAYAEAAQAEDKPTRCQGRIAERCGTDSGTLGRWLKGEGGLDNLCLSTLARLAAGLNVTPGWLAFGTGERHAKRLPPKHLSSDQ